MLEQLEAYQPSGTGTLSCNRTLHLHFNLITHKALVYAETVHTNSNNIIACWYENNACKSGTWNIYIHIWIKLTIKMDMAFWQRMYMQMLAWLHLNCHIDSNNAGNGEKLKCISNPFALTYTLCFLYASILSLQQGLQISQKKRAKKWCKVQRN